MDSKITIGIDIDDTLVKTNEKALEIIKREKYDNVDYYEKLPDLSNFISKHFVEIVKEAELFEGAKEAINLLKERGYKIVIVTSRAYQEGADTPEDTINYLKMKEIKYDNIVLRAPNKIEACIENKIDLFIDDKEKTLDQLSAIGVKCIKMASIDKTVSKYPTINMWTLETIATIEQILRKEQKIYLR